MTSRRTIIGGAAIVGLDGLLVVARAKVPAQSPVEAAKYRVLSGRLDKDVRADFCPQDVCNGHMLVDRLVTLLQQDGCTINRASLVHSALLVNTGVQASFSCIVPPDAKKRLWTLWVPGATTILHGAVRLHWGSAPSDQDLMTAITRSPKATAQPKFMHNARIGLRRLQSSTGLIVVEQKDGSAAHQFRTYNGGETSALLKQIAPTLVATFA